jgi:hypothetical protein
MVDSIVERNINFVKLGQRRCNDGQNAFNMESANRVV